MREIFIKFLLVAGMVSISAIDVRADIFERFKKIICKFNSVSAVGIKIDTLLRVPSSRDMDKAFRALDDADLATNLAGINRDGVLKVFTRTFKMTNGSDPELLTLERVSLYPTAQILAWT